MRKTIVKQKEGSIKPLLLEVRVKDELLKRLSELKKKDYLNLKTLTSILRLPTMTSQYQRAMRRLEDKKVQMEKENESIMFMRSIQVDKNEYNFFEKFVKTVNDERDIEEKELNRLTRSLIKNHQS